MMRSHSFHKPGEAPADATNLCVGTNSLEASLDDNDQDDGKGRGERIPPRSWLLARRQLFAT